MTAEPAKERASYEDLYGIPDNMTGEILDGALVVTPRPSVRHSIAASALGGKLTPPYHFGEGNGPGGWVILDEVEILLGEHLLVPDLAGWRKERFPGPPQENWISIPPDWVCEILSPATVRNDRLKKMRIYAQHAVGHIWLVEPVLKMLEVYRLEAGRWMLLDVYDENDRVRAEPFQEVELHLADLWWE